LKIKQYKTTLTIRKCVSNIKMSVMKIGVSCG
jgi:hypothetical protein